MKLTTPEGEEMRRYQAIIAATALFQRHAAPFLFRFLEWCALLALLLFVYGKTHLWPLKAVYWLALFLLWGYYTELLTRGSRGWVVWAEFFRAKRQLTWLLSLTSTAGMWWASQWFADVFSRNPF